MNLKMTAIYWSFTIYFRESGLQDGNELVLPRLYANSPHKEQAENRKLLYEISVEITAVQNNPNRHPVSS